MNPLFRELLQKLCGKTGPAGLVACTQARSIVPVKILMEPDFVRPVGLLKQSLITPLKGPGAVVPPEEKSNQVFREIVSNLAQRQHLSAPRGAFDFEIISIVAVKLLERLDQQKVDRKPHGPAPV